MEICLRGLTKEPTLKPLDEDVLWNLQFAALFVTCTSKFVLWNDDQKLQLLRKNIGKHYHYDPPSIIIVEGISVSLHIGYIYVILM
ncbi:unnamed protein product [Triticum turgidum subsp. durum]|uniref:Uncharacterized protein n=1 Tax=Triticum turgidum subsp. durum TaxID=4567 RepID=A0A9R0QAY3_TRITD|nr:unnamed protein product [Triticum turgidum subsp. durum]